jgi:putative ABC transport system substrate-binding protein
MNRRDFITLLAGAVAWPLAASARQGGRMRHIGVLMPGDENDPEGKTYVSAFTQALADLGWTVGRNLRMMDLRWGDGDTNRIRTLAHELVLRDLEGEGTHYTVLPFSTPSAIPLAKTP